MNRLHTVYAVSLASIAAAVGLAGGCSSSPGTGGLGIIEPPGTGPDDPQLANVGPRPHFGPTVTAAKPPPPISGGTLLIAKDGKTAIAADPDRDQVYIVDLDKQAVATIPLLEDDEPGRGIEDADQRVHVALRRGGALVTINLATKQVLARRAVCSQPRGIAYDKATDSVHVACGGGELVTLPAAGGNPTRTLHLERDLRDVVVDGDHLLVSRFRSAELLKISANGTLGLRQRPPTSFEGADPSTAWRLIPAPGGGVAMLHQRGQNARPVSVSAGGYSQGGGGGGCDRSIVETALTMFKPGSTSSPALSGAVVPVDVAISPFGQGFAVVAAGNSRTPELQQVLLFQHVEATSPPPPPNCGADGGCNFDAGGPIEFDAGGPGGCDMPLNIPQPQGQATAVAFAGGGHLVVQTREPAGLFMPTTGVTIPLSTVSREDTGHAIFHSNAGGFVACASCHAEGGDDGRVWDFDKIGPRRTQTLRGTVEGTAPYHWNGDMTNFQKLAHDVFTGRMSGAPLEAAQTTVLNRYVNKIPAPAPSPALDTASATRGQQLFEGAGGCVDCHSGSKLTNNATVDVGTGGKFQVPSLIGVSHRAPFLHAGCAPTLKDRFGMCGGGDQHGRTSSFSDAQINDLVKFLETL